MQPVKTRALAVVTSAVAALAVLGPSPTAAAPEARGTVVAQAVSPWAGCGGERPYRPGGGRYSCTFEDDFGGDRLDSSKWVVQETSYSGMTTASRDCYVNDPDNIAVYGGRVRLTNRVEAAPFTCRSPYGDFATTTTAATIATATRFSQTYGRFEFRARMPAEVVQGIHSALWLYPQKHTYGAWPQSGEIDVAEWFSGHASHVFPSVHYAGENMWESTGFDCPVPSSGTQFHRYAVEWTPTVMRFLYDGQLCFQHAWTPTSPLRAPQPFDHPFYVVLSQAFGGGWNAVTAETPRSASMDVDWVRVWR